MSSPGVVETHVSVLVMSGDIVLKFKKPVALPFVDFTDPETRRLACVAEVAGNRRLSPDVYLGVAEVRLDADVLDHAVVMRRLPADRRLSSLVHADPAGALPGGVDDLARLLASFHEIAERSAEIDADGGREALRRTWEHCIALLEPFAGRFLGLEELTEVAHLARRYLRGRGPLFERRIRAGRVCDGHGDLLADDVYVLPDGPRVLDCIDFDDRLRHVDVVADVAFLAMDLERLGAPALARRLVERYEDAAGDHFPPSLLHHYIAQRAIVRAGVACLRAEQLQRSADPEPQRLVALALEHARASRVVLAVVCGSPGSGKSTAALGAGSSLGWPVLRSDEVRRELVDPAARGPLTVAGHPHAYEPAVTETVYATLMDRARSALGQGQSVILDATFADERHRRAVEELARQTASELPVVSLTAPAAVRVRRVGERLRAGLDASGATPELARSSAATPWPRARRVDTSARPAQSVVSDVVGILASSSAPVSAPAA